MGAAFHIKVENSTARRNGNPTERNMKNTVTAQIKKPRGFSGFSSEWFLNLNLRAKNLVFCGISISVGDDLSEKF